MNDKIPIQGSNNIENNKIFTSNTYILCARMETARRETHVTNCNRIRQLIDNIPIELNNSTDLLDLSRHVIKSDGLKTIMLTKEKKMNK